MRAAVVRRGPEVKRIEIEDLPRPVPAGGEVLVEVSRAGICGSDLHGFLDTAGTSRDDGLVMGHEVSGVVVEHGPDVPGSAPAAGTRVTVDPQLVCGRCDACRHGWISICDHKRVTGSSLRGFVHGGMAEYLVVPAACAVPVPDELDDAAAAMLEPLANALHVLNRADLRGHESVLVLGSGPLGLCMLQGLRARGFEDVTATDVSRARLDLAAACGAVRTVDVTAVDLLDALHDDHPKGVDVVIESVGVSATYQQAIAAVRKRGQVMFFGAVQPQVELPLLPILHKELTLTGCTGANDETAEAIELAATGQVDLGRLLTHSFDLEEAERALKVLGDPSSGAVKVQVSS